jgi:uncharacterized protein (DUF924 family)
VAAALHGELGNWSGSDEGALALILLLDQFTRNIHRGTAAAFVGDSTALARARRLVSSGADRRFSKLERWFITCRSSIPSSDRPAGLAAAVRRTGGGRRAHLAWAMALRSSAALAAPHRNQMLGRVSTPEDVSPEPFA